MLQEVNQSTKSITVNFNLYTRRGDWLDSSFFVPEPHKKLLSVEFH